MGTYQVWVKMPDSTVEHTTLREDEWMTLEIDTIDADAAIGAEGWCGTFGVLSGNRVVLQAFGEPTIRVEALAYLNAG